MYRCVTAPAVTVTTVEAESLLLTKQMFQRREPPEVSLGNDLFHTLTGRVEDQEVNTDCGVVLLLLFSVMNSADVTL